MIRFKLPPDFRPHKLERHETVSVPGSGGISIHRGSCLRCGATVDILEHEQRGYTRPVPPDCITIIK